MCRSTVKQEVADMSDAHDQSQALTAEELAEEVWDEESPATGGPQRKPHDAWHPDVNELLEQATAFE